MTDLFSLSGRTALVTGGAQGMGRMIAEALVGAGAIVFITSRDAAMCEATARDIGAHALPGDAGSPDGIAAIGAMLREWGVDRLHILINNAGRTWGAPIEDFPDKAWAGVMQVNVQAPFRMVQEMLPELTAAATADDPARIINIGSISGSITTDVNAYSYGASKAAVHLLSRQLARDLASRNINVNTIIPGYFPTRMTAHIRGDEVALAHSQAQIPAGRYGRPEDIGGAAIFLTSRAGAYVTGVGLPVDGGITGCS